MFFITVQCKTIEEKLPKFQGKYTHSIFFWRGRGRKKRRWREGAAN